ncbi:hypothetical protein CRUP_004549 [Coryphaenoides rupestris]|nr:hypothetical protein CRUP_004549 [Coryphaenoides rupestris]
MSNSPQMMSTYWARSQSSSALGSATPPRSSSTSAGHSCISDSTSGMGRE